MQNRSKEPLNLVQATGTKEITLAGAVITIRDRKKIYVRYNKPKKK